MFLLPAGCERTRSVLTREHSPSPAVSAQAPVGAVRVGGGTASARATDAPSVLPAVVSRDPSAEYFPAEASAEDRRPLLLFFHGLGGSGPQAFDILRLEAFARKRGIFVVAPSGDIDRVGRRYWNAHPACCDFDERGIDHTARIRALIDELLATHPIDPSRVFVMGFSNGGFLAHRLGCLLGDRLAGIVSVAGAGPEPSLGCVTPRRLRVLEVHGDADQTVFYEGGTLFGRKDVTYASADDSLADWAKRLGCRGTASAGERRDLYPTSPGDDTDTRGFGDCEHGSVALWTVRGGTHMIFGRLGVIEQAWDYVSRP